MFRTHTCCLALIALALAGLTGLASGCAHA